MLGRHLDEDEDETVWVLRTALDEAPGFHDRRLEDGNSVFAQMLLGGPDVAHLQPELGGRTRHNVGPSGDFEEPVPEEKHDSAALTTAKLTHRMEAQDLAVESETLVEIPGVDHDAAGEDLHRVLQPTAGTRGGLLHHGVDQGGLSTHNRPIMVPSAKATSPVLDARQVGLVVGGVVVLGLIISLLLAQA